jgi:hypothetical protein
MLADIQFELWKNKSRLDSLSLIYSDTVNAFENNEIFGAVFMDIKAAYNNVLISILIERVAKMNIPKLMLKFVYNFTSKRHLNIKFDTIDVIRRDTHGLPQGSVLSPLLCNIYVECLATSVEGLCKVLQFADDVGIYTTDTSPDEALPKLEPQPES